MCLIGKLPKSKNHHELTEIFLFCFLGNCEPVDYCKNTAYAAGEKLKYSDSRVTYHKSVYTETAEQIRARIVCTPAINAGRGLTHMRSMCVGVAETGGEHCSPAKNHKVTFLLLALLSDQKRGKSHLRGFSILLKITFRVHELVARAMRGKRVRQRAERKSAVSRYPQFQLYHACEHITRDSRADSCTHCLHARIIGVAGVGGVCTLTGLSK